jgi:hypothetical protein
MNSPKQPAPDPAITAQAKAAQGAQEQAVQASLSSDTLSMLRLFGQANAMSGAGMTAPMSSIMGGKAPSGVGR